MGYNFEDILNTNNVDDFFGFSDADDETEVDDTEDEEPTDTEEEDTGAEDNPETDDTTDDTSSEDTDTSTDEGETEDDGTDMASEDGETSEEPSSEDTTDSGSTEEPDSNETSDAEVEQFIKPVEMKLSAAKFDGDSPIRDKRLFVDAVVEFLNRLIGLYKRATASVSRGYTIIPGEVIQQVESLSSRNISIIEDFIRIHLSAESLDKMDENLQDASVKFTINQIRICLPMCKKLSEYIDQMGAGKFSKK